MVAKKIDDTVSHKGLSIIGCEAKAGKTVVMTGLCASLKESGYDIRAIKPITLSNQNTSDSEHRFISHITRQAQDYKVSYISSPGMLSSENWQEAISISRSPDQITFVELPGSTATPLTWTNNKTIFWQDTANFANDLGLPCLLVAKYSFECIEQLIVNTAYLKRKQIPIIGLVLVRTMPEMESVSFFPEPIDIALAERTGVPYLGTIPFSPSISVPYIRQGNLIKLISQSLDILPIIDVIGLPNIAPSHINRSTLAIS
jgi:dethiobiotin synthetase